MAQFLHEGFTEGVAVQGRGGPFYLLPLFDDGFLFLPESLLEARDLRLLYFAADKLFALRQFQLVLVGLEAVDLF